MQTWSSPTPARAASPTRKFTTIVIFLFSLAGLIAGFALGGFRSHATNGGPGRPQGQVTQGTGTPVTTPTTQPIVALSFPQTINLSAAIQQADGTTSYSITIQTVDKQKKPVHASNITCKAWLVQQIPDGKTLNIDEKTLKAFSTLSAPIQGTLSGDNQPVSEVLNSLNFDPATPQTHFCNANGRMTWHYTIATGVPPGQYDLVLLTDWQGIHYNWSWDMITIK